MSYLFYSRNIVVNKSIVHYSVLGEYLGIRTSDNRLFLFYKPSYIGYVKKSYLWWGIALIIIGLLMVGLNDYLKEMRHILDAPSEFFDVLFIIGGIVFLIGIILLFLKKRFLVIETHGGTRVLFVNPEMTDEDIQKIFTRFAEDYGVKLETENYTHNGRERGFYLYTK